LSYQGGGVRVEETPSWVGLGWNLNAGGMITRVVKGLPDEHENGFHNYPLYIPDSYLTEATSNGYFRATESELPPLYSINNQIVDAEADIFYYNFNGYSGKIIIDKSGTPIPIPYENIKIESYNNTAEEDQWIITTPDGTKYVFGRSLDGTRVAVDNTSSESETVGSEFLSINDFISSWHLVEIISPIDNEKIELFYESSYIQNGVKYSTEEYIARPFSGGPCDIPDKRHRTEITGNELTVSEISSSHYTINFTTSGREDLFSGGKKLEEITVNSSSGEFLKSFTFQTSYFYSTQFVLNTEEYQKKRLKLDGVVETGQGYASLPPYLFEYISPSDKTLPPKNSFAQDYWGFYNGADDNESLIPYIPFSNHANYESGNNREPNSTYAVIGTLNKIIYPTGGYKVLEYEANKISYESIISEEGLPYDRIVRTSAYSTLAKQACVKSVEYQHPEICENEEENIIDIDASAAQFAYINWHLQYLDDQEGEGLAQVSIIPLEGQKDEFGNPWQFNKYLHQDGCDPFNCIGSTFKFMPPGQYKMLAINSYGEGLNLDQAYLQVAWEDQIFHPNVPKSIVGLKI